MRKFFLLAFCFAAIHSFAQITNDRRLVSLDTAFQRVLKTWNVSGFAIAVVDKSKIIYAKGFGYRDYEKKLPVTPATLFAIGSCTKAFTASLIGLLQKDGKLDIDKPVHQYDADLNFYSAELTNTVTLRDMMSHRTGLPRHDFSWYLFPTTTRDSLIRRIQYQQPNYPLRRIWQYNNFMFMAQGALVEKLTGKSWEENIKEKFLQPLNMNSTVFSVNDLERNSNASLGYGIKKDSVVYKMPYYNIDAPGPAGSINSNVLDMSNWVITWINNGRFNGKEVLSSDFMKEAMSSQTIISSGFPTKEKPDLYFSTYGFAWFLSSYKGHYRIEHGGNIDGFSASTSFFPTDSIGIIVLTNQDASSVPAVVRNIIADRLFGKSYFNWNDDLRNTYLKARQQAKDAEKSKVSTQKTGTSPSHALRSYEGLYSNPGYGTFDIVYKNDSLFAYTPGKLIWLKHYHYDVFIPYLLDDNRFDTSQTVDFRIQFNTGINGEIESLNAVGFESPEIPLNFKKASKEKSIAKTELGQYTGSFEIAETEIKFYVKGGSLYMFVPNQPEYELTSVDTDKFSVKNLSGYAILFLRNDNKEIDAVNLIQPNGTFKAEKKK